MKFQVLIVRMLLCIIRFHFRAIHQEHSMVEDRLVKDAIRFVESDSKVNERQKV